MEEIGAIKGKDFASEAKVWDAMKNRICTIADVLAGASKFQASLLPESSALLVGVKKEKRDDQTWILLSARVVLYKDFFSNNLMAMGIIYEILPF
jgi:hypothetical protein